MVSKINEYCWAATQFSPFTVWCKHVLTEIHLLRVSFFLDILTSIMSWYILKVVSVEILIRLSLNSIYKNISEKKDILNKRLLHFYSKNLYMWNWHWILWSNNLWSLIKILNYTFNCNRCSVNKLHWNRTFRLVA